MAWRKPQQPPRVEPPEWYRNYHPEAWDQPGRQELEMINGSLGQLKWPDCMYRTDPAWLEFHDAHARSRWQQAKYEYRRQHPDLAEQEFNEIRNARATPRTSDHGVA